MKVLIASRAPYWPLTRGGSSVMLRHIAESFVQAGHEVVHLATVRNVARHAEFLAISGHDVRSRAGMDVFHRDGYAVHAVSKLDGYVGIAEDTIRAFRPEGVLIAMDCTGPGERSILASDVVVGVSNVVYMLGGAINVPAGPLAQYPSAENVRLMRRARLVSICRTIDTYLRTWTDLTSEVYYPPMFGAGPFPRLVARDGFVTLVNACAWKGLPILLEVARALPDIRFAAVHSWGTTARDVQAMRALPNLTILEFTSDIEDILRRTRVLLVPSLLPEGFPLVCIEAMLRGVPVVASTSGGLPEAKLGTRHLIPTRVIERFTGESDENGLPIGEIPPQDLGPWIESVQMLATDDRHFDEESDAERRAATEFVAGLGVEPLVRWFREARA